MHKLRKACNPVVLDSHLELAALDDKFTFDLYK